MTDGIDRTLEDVFAEHQASSADQLVLWSFGTEMGGPVKDSDAIAPGVDLPGLRVIANAASGRLIQSTVDDADVERVLRDVQTHLVNAIESDENLLWHDAGYYLVWPLMLFALIWSRRGWTVVWA